MIPATELQMALHEYQAWGEKLRTPREVRLAAMLPHRNSHEIAVIMTACKEVEDFSWEIAKAVNDDGLTQPEAQEKIRLRFPFMSAENLSRTFGLAMYYTLKL